MISGLDFAPPVRFDDPAKARFRRVDAKRILDALATQVGADSLRYGLLAMVIPQVIAAWCNLQAAKTIDKDFED